MWNPLNWIKVLLGIKTLFEGVLSVFKYVQEARLKRSVEKKKVEIEQAAQDLKKANEVTDDDQRLKAKSEAACKLEKASNPDADCNSSVLD